MRSCILLFAFIQMPASPAHALLDFVGDAARDSVKGSAYVGLVSDLLNEMDEKNEISPVLNQLRDRNAQLVSDARSIAAGATPETFQIPKSDWSFAHLDRSLRYTMEHVKRVKKAILNSSVLGADVATAVNTAQTNSVLQEFIKNQQAQILMQKEQALSELERSQQEQRGWESFIARERKVRSGKKQ